MHSVHPRIDGNEDSIDSPVGWRITRVYFLLHLGCEAARSLTDKCTRTYTHENTRSRSEESYHCALLKILSLQSFEP